MQRLKEFLSYTLMKNGQYASIKQGEYLETEVKEDETLVTEIDLKLSDVIGEDIREYSEKNNLDYYIVDEEKSPVYSEYDKAEYSWVIDPIDGTVNYSLNFPMWGISIGLLKNNKPYAGGIYLPSLKVMILTDNEKVYTYDFEEQELIEYKEPKRNLSNNTNANILTNMTNCANREYRVTEGMNSIYNSAICNLYYTIVGTSLATIQAVKLWDNAACFSIGSVLGFKIYDIDTQQEVNIYDKDYLNKDFSFIKNLVFVKEANREKIFSIIEKRNT
jgi:myo-inositol-1(or 4)-monophosphatase